MSNLSVVIAVTLLIFFLDKTNLLKGMTRFARASKKTSLEATPWHELVNSGGNDNDAEYSATNVFFHKLYASL